MWNNILTIYLKELKEVLRDKRTVVFMLVLPTFLVPLLMNILIGFIVKAEKKAKTEVLTFAVFGAEHLPDLAGAFNEEKGFKKVDIPTQDAIESAIEQNKIRFGLVIPQTARQQIEQGGQVAIKFYFNNASVTSKVEDRAGTVINEFNRKYRAERLAELGMNTPQEQERLLNPITIEEHNTADMREVLGERMGGMLPYLFILFCLMGAMHPAIDLGAGEKERGTMETILLAPIRRYQIVLGKFLVIFTSGITSALLCLTSIGVMFAIKGHGISGELGQVIASVSTVDLVLVASMLIPTAAMFAAALLSVSVYAKSFKEASSYCAPLNFLAIVPAFIAMLPIVELNWFWALVPVTNISLAIKELIKGTMNYEMLIAILGSSFIIAGAFLLFCTKWFERETVLFRQ